MLSYDAAIATGVRAFAVATSALSLWLGAWLCLRMWRTARSPRVS